MNKLMEAEINHELFVADRGRRTEVTMRRRRRKWRYK